MKSSSGKFDIRMIEELASVNTEKSDTVFDVTEEVVSLKTETMT